MTDQNLSDFRARLRRIDLNNTGGYTGKVARAAGLKPGPNRKDRGLYFNLILLILGAFFIKAMIVDHWGLRAYEAKVAEMQRGDAIQRTGALVMQVDPVTEFMRKLRKSFR